jgi:hypothetical protein
VDCKETIPVALDIAPHELKQVNNQMEQSLGAWRKGALEKVNMTLGRSFFGISFLGHMKYDIYVTS